MNTTSPGLPSQPLLYLSSLHQDTSQPRHALCEHSLYLFFQKAALSLRCFNAFPKKVNIPKSTTRVIRIPFPFACRHRPSSQWRGGGRAEDWIVNWCDPTTSGDYQGVAPIHLSTWHAAGEQRSSQCGPACCSAEGESLVCRPLPNLLDQPEGRAPFNSAGRGRALRAINAMRQPQPTCSLSLSRVDTSAHHTCCPPCTYCTCCSR